MTYSFRLSLTDNAANKIPMPAPDNYDPARFEVMRRYVAAGDAIRSATTATAARAARSTATTRSGGSSRSAWSAAPRAGHSADEAGRAAIFEAHKQYTLEFIHFLSNDPVLPSPTATSAASLGAVRGRVRRYGHFPPQLYVRESRRMQGMHVITENDIIGKPDQDDPIAVSSFPIDSHDCQRIAYPGGGVRNEGTIFPVSNRTRSRATRTTSPIARSCRCPPQCDNLLVPVALSCTHVGISSLRIEGTWMVIGQSAGIAAALAATGRLAVQDLPYANLASACWPRARC